MKGSPTSLPACYYLKFKFWEILKTQIDVTSGYTWEVVCGPGMGDPGSVTTVTRDFFLFFW